MCYMYINVYINIYINTVLSGISAAAFIKFYPSIVRRLFKGGVYSRAALIEFFLSFPKWGLSFL